MATYPEWRKLQRAAVKAGRKHDSKRLVYVCGNEVGLRKEVIRVTKRRTGIDNQVSITATGENDGDIWTELNTHPLIARRALPTKPGEKPKFEYVERHITVYDAHRIKNWAPLLGWLDHMKDVSVTFDSDLPDFCRPLTRRHKTYCPRGHPLSEFLRVTIRNEREIRECEECVAVRALVVKRGRLVFASSPTTEAAQNKHVDMLCEIYEPLGATPWKMKLLLRKTGWSVTAAIEVLSKLALVGAPLGETNYEAALLTVTDTAYEEALRFGDKAKAATLAHDIPEDQVPFIIERLDEWIGAVSLASHMARSGQRAARIKERTGVNYGLAVRLEENAARYSDEATERCIEALAQASRDWAQGHRTGVLEMLAAMWR